MCLCFRHFDLPRPHLPDLLYFLWLSYTARAPSRLLRSVHCSFAAFVPHNIKDKSCFRQCGIKLHWTFFLRYNCENLSKDIVHNKDFHISNLTLAIFKNIVFVCIVFILSMMKILYILKYIFWNIWNIRCLIFEQLH